METTKIIFACLGLVLGWSSVAVSMVANLQCNGRITVYVDGEQQTNTGVGVFRGEIPDTSSLVAVSCTPTSRDIGLRGYLSNGYMTDDTWKSTSVMFPSWYENEYSDAGWARAEVVAGQDAQEFSSFPSNARQIWSGSGKDTVYFRRKIDHVNLKAACKGRNLQVYVDGRLVMEEEEGMDLLQTDLPGTPELVAVSCDMTKDPKGLIAVASNGLMTDFSWKCSSRYSVNWASLDFDDSAWVNPYQGYYNKPGTNLYHEEIRSDAAWMWMSYHTYCRRRVGSSVLMMFDDAGVVYSDGKYRGQTEQKVELWSYNLHPDTTLVTLTTTANDDDQGTAVAKFYGLSSGSVSWKCQSTTDHLWWTKDYDDSAWSDANVQTQGSSQLSDLFSGADWISHSGLPTQSSKSINCRGRLSIKCDCQYRCITRDDGGYECTCPLRYILGKDKKNCIYMPDSQPDSSRRITTTTSKKSNSSAIVGGVIATILIVLAAAGAVLIWFRRRQLHKSENYKTLHVEFANDYDGAADIDEQPVTRTRI